jgi:high-affinity iron transporter
LLATLIVVFREMIEAGLIVGIVMAATKTIPQRSLWVAYGIIGGIAGACLVAIFAGSISSALSGLGQELFNVSILIIAVLMLAWHNVWMARHGREIAVEMRALGEDVSNGQRSLVGLAVVIGIAILREGSEAVLFVYGIAISGGDTSASMITGSILGLALGVGVAVLMYFGLVKISARHLFKVTSWLIALLASGMAAQAVAFLQQAGIFNYLTQVVWDTSHIISNGSVAGKVLRTLMGYTATPNLMQLIIYVTTLSMIFALMKLFGHSVHHNKTVPQL